MTVCCCRGEKGEDQPDAVRCGMMQSDAKYETERCGA